jgi:glycosyltransferase involved in cell wall biosynthesis
MKIYGIFLAYPPTIDLRNEGLGRYLAAFLKGAANRKDVRFVVVCPSWTKHSLQLLFDAEQVPKDFVDVRAPRRQPPLLKLHEIFLSFKSSKRFSRWKRFVRRLGETKEKFFQYLIDKTAGAGSFLELALVLGPVIVVLVALLPVWFSLLIGSYLTVVFWKLLLSIGGRFEPFWQRIHRIFAANPKNDPFVLRLYSAMRQSEEKRILKLVDQLAQVNAWYCPAPFWPAFNKIKKPKLLCVPDIVLSDFSVGFANLGGDRMLGIFSEIEEAVRGAEKFVTYSECVKWETLVDRYCVNPDNVAVVRHAPSNLNNSIHLLGIENEHEATLNFCRFQFLNSIFRCANIHYLKGIENPDLKFIFYASQFRPNKNMLTLLRAYKNLIERDVIKHKLILSGNPLSFRAVHEFISAYRLQDDILCLHGLKTQELAACYKLADLAVNPSLSEGGCPFTFTEALSVDTPVVMARIPVTEEVLTDPELQKMTFFDPYDWQNLAERIQWALSHREELLALQRRTYAELSRRTWSDVVNEHLIIFERIAQEKEQFADSLA